MTMRTRTDYACECGHTGYSILSENDQPYSQPWESFALHGFSQTADKDDPKSWKCPACGQIGKVSYA